MSFPVKVWGVPQSPPLLFLHGFMGSKEDWEEVAQALSSHFYCLAIDLPGHGENERIDFLSFNDFLEEFKNFCLTLPSNLSIIGYSLGGRVALASYFCSKIPFKKLVIESANPGILNLSQKQKRLSEDLSLFSQIKNQNDLNSFLNHWYEMPLFGNIKNHPSFSKLIEQKSYTQIKNWQRSLNLLSVGAFPNLWEKLYELDIPLCYIAGSLDQKYVEIGEKLSSISSQILFKKIDNCAHNTHFERPNIFCELINNYCGG